MKTRIYLLVTLFLFGATNASTAKDKNPSLKIDYKVKAISCTGSNDGKIEIEISGGHPPYIIAWDNCKSDLVLEGLRDGDYSVKVCDAKGNEILESFKLINPAPLTVNFNTTQETYLDDLDQRVNMAIKGGTPWEIESTLWYNIEVLEEDQVETTDPLRKLTITDAHGCQIRKNVVLNFIHKTKKQDNILNIIVEDQTETASLRNPE
jgi:hypothetical protein